MRSDCSALVAGPRLVATPTEIVTPIRFPCNTSISDNCSFSSRFAVVWNIGEHVQRLSLTGDCSAHPGIGRGRGVWVEEDRQRQADKNRYRRKKAAQPDRLGIAPARQAAEQENGNCKRQDELGQVIVTSKVIVTCHLYHLCKFGAAIKDRPCSVRARAVWLAASTFKRKLFCRASQSPLSMTSFFSRK